MINALREEVDKRRFEFLKSGKLLPVPFSSRHYDFKRQQWVFGKATDEAMAEFVERKVYWETKLGTSTDAGENARVRAWIGDPAEAQYLQALPRALAGSGGAAGGAATPMVGAAHRLSRDRSARDLHVYLDGPD